MIQGEGRADRIRDDRPKIDDLPRLPPGVALNAAEQEMWNWLMANVVVPGVHGTGDGAGFVRICKLWSRVSEADRRCEKFGLVMKNPRSGKPELQPYARLNRDLWQQLGSAFAEIGASPIGRYRLAPQRRTGAIDAKSWDEMA